MSKTQHTDIDDNQIRIITSDSSGNGSRPSARKSRRKVFVLIIAAVALFVVFLCIYRQTKTDPAAEQLAMTVETPTIAPADTTEVDTVAAPLVRARVKVQDTVINGAKFTILKPVDAKPALAVGKESLNDTAAILVVQAADVRRDNGKIVGAFVAKGQLLSSGQSKAGFCAIIGNNITIEGVS